MLNGIFLYPHCRHGRGAKESNMLSLVIRSLSMNPTGIMNAITSESIMEAAYLLLVKEFS
jgi:hypothetical protein